MSDVDYALDAYRAVRHVATELDRAAPAALSFEDLVASYSHPGGDLARIRRAEHLDTDRAALEWLVRHALDELRTRGKTGVTQVEEDAEGYRLAIPFDELRYERKAIKRIPPPARFEGVFDPTKNGRWADNIRHNSGKDSMEELRESLRGFGWLPELPAILDERGVILVGHRRMAVADELGIEPQTKRIHIGDGDEADARRFALAIASNLGAKPLTPGERQDLAEYLYGERGWTMARIAEALQVHVDTISNDLIISGVPKNGERRGRPRKITSEQETEVVHRSFDLDQTRDTICEEMDLTVHQVYATLQRETGRRQAATQPAAPVETAAPAEVDEASPMNEAPAPHTCICSVCGRIDEHDGGEL